MQEIDGDLEAAGAVVVTGRNAVIHEAEVEVTAENATVVAVDEATVAAIREVVALLAIVMVNCYKLQAKRLKSGGTINVLTRNCFSSEVIGKSYWSSER